MGENDFQATCRQSSFRERTRDAGNSAVIFRKCDERVGVVRPDRAPTADANGAGGAVESDFTVPLLGAGVEEAVVAQLGGIARPSAGIEVGGRRNQHELLFRDFSSHEGVGFDGARPEGEIDLLGDQARGGVKVQNYLELRVCREELRQVGHELAHRKAHRRRHVDPAAERTVARADRRDRIADAFQQARGVREEGAPFLGEHKIPRIAVDEAAPNGLLQAEKLARRRRAPHVKGPRRGSERPQSGRTLKYTHISYVDIVHVFFPPRNSSTRQQSPFSSARIHAPTGC